jgi:hypothetical protein
MQHAVTSAAAQQHRQLVCNCLFWGWHFRLIRSGDIHRVCEAAAQQHAAITYAAATCAERTPCMHLLSCRGFKALKQIVKLLFKLGRREEMMEAYK